MVTTTPKLSGWDQWVKNRYSIQLGCPNNCLYCHGLRFALRRKKHNGKSSENWSEFRINWESVRKRWEKQDGLIGFPHNHDIVEENLDACIETLRNMLAPGNHVMLVSKPRMSCIPKLCEDLEKHKDRILFRFTIGCYDQSILDTWESAAPSYSERLSCLEYAFEHGFRTSVSVEPMLDPVNINRHVDALLPFVTEDIYIGTMNWCMVLTKRMSRSDPEWLRLKKACTDDKIIDIVRGLGNNPQISWKDSIQKIVERTSLPITSLLRQRVLNPDPRIGTVAHFIP